MLNSEQGRRVAERPPGWLRFVPAAGLCVVVAMHGGPAPAAGGSGRHRARAAQSEDARPFYARGRLIVRYRDSVPYCVHDLLENHRSFVAAGTRGGEALDRLHERYGVRSAEPLFRSALEEERLRPKGGLVTLDALRRLHDSRYAATRARFSPRSRRGPTARRPDSLHHVYVLEIGRRIDPAEAARSFAGDPNVAWAHPDYLVTSTWVPDDPYFSSSGAWGQPYEDLWGLQEGKLDMPRAWDVSRGKGVVIAVVDTGVDYRHPDIQKNVWRNPGEVEANGIDDDGNGYVDDVLGWDFSECGKFNLDGECIDETTEDADPLDVNGHGTHVAGTAAAVGDNGMGITGVAPRATVMAVRFLNADATGLSSYATRALHYAAENGADVINNSWSCGYCPDSRAMDEAVRSALELGAVVVFAAGNSGRDNRANNPQNLRDPKPIVVAATNPRDRLAFFSSLGTSVDVAAPGGGRGVLDSNILSLRSAVCALCKSRLEVDDKYLRIQGTSMAAPHVSGLAALLIAARPGLDAEQIRQLIRSTSTDIGARGYDVRSGAGRIDAGRALLERARPLTVRLERLKNSSVVPRRLRVRASVDGPDLAYYQLFTSSQLHPRWQPLGGIETRPLAGEEIRTVQRGQLDRGWTLLRLTATTHDGREFHDVVGLGRQPQRLRIGKGLAGVSGPPSVSGKRVVWMQYSGPDEVEGHVYLLDTASGKQHRVSEEQVEGLDVLPQISGRHVVWHSEPEGHDGLQTVFHCMFDPVSGACPNEVVTYLEQRFRHPKVSGSRVLWDERFDLVGMDFATGEKVEIGHGPGLEYRIAGDLVAWDERGEFEGAAHVFDWSTGKTTTLWTGPAYVLGIAATGRRVFLATGGGDDPGADGRGAEVRMLNVDSGKTVTRKLADGIPVGAMMATLRSRIFWSFNREIEQYDVRRETRRGLVMLPPARRKWPSVSRSILAWLEQDHPDGREVGRIFYAPLPGA